MAKLTVKQIDRVTAVREPGEDWPDCPTWMPAFTITPHRLVIEWDTSPAMVTADPAGDGLVHLTVVGERFRHLKAGPKSTGSSMIEFGPGNVPVVLWDLLRKIARARYAAKRSPQ